MSDPIPLPPDTADPTILTFTVPHVLLGSSADGQEMHVRNGRSVQLEREIAVQFAFEPADDRPFRIIATSRRVFAGFTLDVLDENSNPTAQDYLDRAGKRTLLAFRCTQNLELTKQHGRPVFHIYRQFGILP